MQKTIGPKIFSGHHMLWLVKKLREKSTKAEELLREKIRWRQIWWLKFRRQHPLGNYIIDFYCVSKKLAIELDGWIHTTKDQKESDKERDKNLATHGIKTLRFKNKEIFENIENVLKKILTQ